MAHHGEGVMLKEEEEEEILDFDRLPKEKQLEIEQIIEKKIKERHEEELQRLLREVTAEIEKTQEKLKQKVEVAPFVLGSLIYIYTTKA